MTCSGEGVACSYTRPAGMCLCAVSGQHVPLYVCGAASAILILMMKSLE